MPRVHCSCTSCYYYCQVNTVELNYWQILRNLTKLHPVALNFKILSCNVLVVPQKTVSYYNCLISAVMPISFFFKLGFTPYKAGQPVQGM